jgi:hypothetical protein
VKVLLWLCSLGLPLLVSASEELGKELNPRKAAWEAAVERSEHVRYDVVHRAVLGIPRDPDDRFVLESMELWHTLPVLRPWSEPGDSHGAIEVSFSPQSGAIEYRDDYEYE